MKELDGFMEVYPNHPLGIGAIEKYSGQFYLQYLDKNLPTLKEKVEDKNNFFKDENFRKVIVDIYDLPGKGQDGSPMTEEDIETLETKEIDELDLSNKGIEDFIGINHLKKVKNFNLSNNKMEKFEIVSKGWGNEMDFESIDLSNNINLKEIYIEASYSDNNTGKNDPFQAINLDGLTALEKLEIEAYGSELSYIEINKLNNLKSKDIKIKFPAHYKEGKPKTIAFKNMKNFKNEEIIDLSSLMNVEQIDISNNGLSDKNKIKLPNWIRRLIIDDNNYENLNNKIIQPDHESTNPIDSEKTTKRRETNFGNLAFISAKNNNIKNVDVYGLYTVMPNLVASGSHPHNRDDYTHSEWGDSGRFLFDLSGNALLGHNIDKNSFIFYWHTIKEDMNENHSVKIDASESQKVNAVSLKYNSERQ